jgi:hypothetical protein
LSYAKLARKSAPVTELRHKALKMYGTMRCQKTPANGLGRQKGGLRLRHPASRCALP